MFLRRCLTVPQQGNQHDFFANAPQHVPPFHDQATSPEPFAHHLPTPHQPPAENLRQLALRYLHRPDSQVDLVSIGAGPAALCKVVIVVELADVL